MKEASQKEALQQLMDCLVAQSETDMTQQIMEQALAWYQAKHVCLYEVDDDRKKAVLVNGSPDICMPYIDGEVLENWLNQCKTDSFLTLSEESSTMLSASWKSCLVIPVGKEGKVSAFFFVVQPKKHLDDDLFGRMAATLIYREGHRFHAAVRAEETDRTSAGQSVSAIYSSMYTIDLRTFQFSELSSVSSVHSHIGSCGDAREKLEHFWKYMVYPEFQDEIRQFTDLKTLAERMGNRRIVTKQYQSTLFYDQQKDKVPVWNQCSFIEEKRDEEGNLISVIFATQTVNEEKIRQLTETRQLKQSNASLMDLLAQEKQYTSITGVLSNVYYSLYYIDLDNHTFQEIVSHGRMHHLLGEKGDARAALKGMTEELVRPSFQKAMYEFTDIDTLDKRLFDHQILSMDYEAISGGWTQCTFIPVVKDETGHTRSVICTQRWITAEKEVEIQNSIIRALAEPYENIYIINGETGYIRSYRMGDYMTKRYGSSFSEGRYDENVRVYTANEVWKEDRKLFDPIADVASVEQLMKDRQTCSFSFRVFRNNALIYYQCQLVRLNPKNREYLIAFKNIDEEKKLELAQQRRIEEALLAVENVNASLREESLVSSALSLEYCSIFEIDPARKEVSLYRTDGKSLPASALQKLLDLKDYETAIQAYIDTYVIEQDRQRLRKSLTLSALAENVPDYGLFKVGYRRLRDGMVSYYEMNTVRSIDRQGNPMYVLAIRDVDEETRRQLNQSRQMEVQREIIEGLGSEYYSVLLVDPSLDKVTVYRQQEAEGKAIAEFFRKHDFRWTQSIHDYSRQLVSLDSRTQFLEKLSVDCIVKEQNDYSFTYEKINGNDVIYLQIRVAYVRDQHGSVMAVIGTRNVDDLIRREKQQEAALRAACEAAEAANRAKSEFLSHMSHDIRTPMNGIIGMTAIAAANIHDPDRVSDCLKKTTLAGRHLLSLINEVLDMSRIESGKVDLREEDFNLSDLFDNLITMTGPQIAQHHHQLNVRIQDVVHEDVIGDALRIQKIFTNLMSNAVKYTPDGGNIHLTIREKPSGNIRSACYEIIFEDNGIGMSAEFVDHIFEPFTRSTDVSEVQGTGLGMAISRNIARMMGGDITVESTPGKGSKFTVTLYLKLQEHDPFEYECFADVHVLVADDDETALKTCCDMLNELGMKAWGVTCGKEAVQQVIDRYDTADAYSICILDWKMPDQNGIETARQIRKAVGNDVPIIVLSAYDWSAIEQQAKEAGVNAFIGKPLFRSRVIRTFNALLNGRNQEQAVSVYDLAGMKLTGHSVLIVEDNELNAEISKEILQMTGLSVNVVTDGLEAVQEMKTCADQAYDLIFMDIQMPGMNGYDAVRAIRAMDRNYCRSVPIIAMTANAFAEDVQAAKAAGMNEHIAKPLDLTVLAGILNEWIVERQK